MSEAVEPSPVPYVAPVMGRFQLNQNVTTPFGPGVFQFYLLKPDGVIKLVVSQNKEQAPPETVKGLWRLLELDDCDVEYREEKRRGK